MPATAAPFRLRLEPARLEDAVRTLRRLSAAASAQAAALRRTSSALSTSWQGTAASDAVAEVDGLARLIERSGEPLVAAAAALSALAAEYRHALDVALPALCRRWEQLEQEHRLTLARVAAAEAAALTGLPVGREAAERAQARGEAAARADRARDGAADGLLAEQALLQREFEQLRASLAEATQAAAHRLGGAVLVPVHPALAALTRGGGLGSGLATGLLGARVVRALGAELPLSALAASARQPPTDLASCRALLDRARAAGLPPRAYADTLGAFWLLTAAHRAGIEPATWDPARGAVALRDVVQRVYRYYGDLFLADRDLQWAGMANAIGPSFAAGFADLAMFRDWARSVQRLPLPTGVEGHVLDTAAGLTDADLRAYEERFLRMQREIFTDQAPAHEAYLTGGTAAIGEMARAGLLAPGAARAWADIASGDPQRVAAGNLRHLYREQHDVIARHYDWMRDRPTGPVVTWGATLVGAPAVPGARSLPEVYPLVLRDQTPGPPSVLGRDNPLQGTVVLTTPLPDGNISVLEDRWRLIVDDTLPAYQALLADGDRAEQLARRDVGERIGDQRLSEQWDDLARRLVTGVRVRFEQ